MFTGLVETKGKLARRTRQGQGFRLSVEASLTGYVLGESISVNGACLTVVSFDARGFEADVSLETNQKTTLGKLDVGSAVNLERALKVGDRLGGHLVSGHVDAVATVADISPAGEAKRFRISYPKELARFIAAKGSVALDGVSLTVNAVSGDEFEVMLIPHTLSVTTLGEFAPGSALNLEVDTLARYAVRYLEVTASGDAEGGLKAALRRSGFTPD